MLGAEQSMVMQLTGCATHEEMLADKEQAAVSAATPAAPAQPGVLLSEPGHPSGAPARQNEIGLSQVRPIGTDALAS